jgi:hypothetical protein
MRKKYKSEIEADELASSMGQIISSDSHKKNFGLVNSISKQASTKEPQTIKIAKCSAEDCKCGSKCSCGDKCEGKECKACKKCAENVKSAFTQICQSLLSHADTLDQLNLPKSATDLLKVTSNLLKEAACEIVDENNANVKDIIDLPDDYFPIRNLEGSLEGDEDPISSGPEGDLDPELEAEHDKESIEDTDIDDLLAEFDESQADDMKFKKKDLNNVSDTGKALGLTDEKETEMSGIQDIDLEQLQFDDSESAKILREIFEKHPDIKKEFLSKTNTADIPRNFPRSPKSPGRLDQTLNYEDLSLPKFGDDDFDLPSEDLETDIDELGNDNDFLGEKDTDFPATKKSKEARLFAKIKKWAESDEEYLEEDSDEDKLEKMFNKYKQEYDAKFAEDGAAQLDWVYKNSEYYEDTVNQYPIYRIR